MVLMDGWGGSVYKAKGGAFHLSVSEKSSNLGFRRLWLDLEPCQALVLSTIPWRDMSLLAQPTSHARRSKAIPVSTVQEEQ